MKEKTKVEAICQGLLSIPVKRIRPFTNLVMACSSHCAAKSVVELTSSPHFHYHYSNISKVSEYLTKKEEDYEKTLKIFLKYFLDACSVKPQFEEVLGNYYVLGQDMCMVDKTHSACLAGRVYGHTSNKLDQGIVAGYKVCFTHLHLNKGWSLPIDMAIVSPTDEHKSDATLLAVRSLKTLLEDKELPFGDTYCINNADSGYGNAKFLSPLYQYEKLINIVRFRGGMKVYKAFSGAQIDKQKPKIYGEVAYLISQTSTKTFKIKDKKTKEISCITKEQISIFDTAFDDFSEEQIVLGNGRKGIKKVWSWKNYLLRTKNGNSMQDKPFDIVKVEIWNEDNTEKIFDRDMFLSVNGQGKNKLTSLEVQQHYRTRFDTEGCYRFSKQNLFLDSFQTPDKQHYLNYLLVILCTWWLLYAAKDEVKLACPVWQKYLPIHQIAEQAIEKQEKLNLTPSQVRKGMENLFHTFDKTPYLPQKYEKGLGRKAGAKMTKRARRIPYKKPKKGVKKE